VWAEGRFLFKPVCLHRRHCALKGAKGQYSNWAVLPENEKEYYLRN
jgi:hypothetical protein